MLESYNITILKIEGLGDIRQTHFSISLNNKILDSMSMNSQNPYSTQISAGFLKFEIRSDATADLIASVSLQASLIQNPGFAHLPLFLSPEDSISSLPEEIAPPRVLIDVQPCLQSSIIELSESSEYTEEVSEEQTAETLYQLRSKNLDLRIQNIELEKHIHEVKRNAEKEISNIVAEFKASMGKLNAELEKYKVYAEINTRVNNEMVREIQALRNAVEVEREEKYEIQERYGRCIKIYQEIKDREDSILCVLEEKNKEILNLRDTASMRIGLGIERQGSLAVIGNQGENVGNSDKGLKLNGKECLGIGKGNQEIEKISGKFGGLEDLDEKVRQSLGLLNLDGFATVCNELIYFLGNRKKVNIFEKNSLVCVREGGSIKTLGSYIYNSCTKELQAFVRKKQEKRKTLLAESGTHRRSNTGIDIEKLEKSIISKTFDASLHQGKNKSLKAKFQLNLHSPITRIRNK